MVLNLSFSYSGWFSILPVPAFAFCNLGGVAGALTGEDRGKNLMGTSAFSISQVTRSLFPAEECLHFP